MRNLVLTLSLFFPLVIMAQSKVGINVSPAESTLDVRSEAEVDSPAFLLATPAKGHFLRLYAGREDDPTPFLWYAQDDTFRMISGAADYSDMSTRLAMLPNGNIGINPASSSDVIYPFMVFSDLISQFPQTDVYIAPGSEVYPINGTFGAAQRFTAGLEGFLNQIDVFVRSIGPGNAKFSYTLRENDHNGLQLAVGSVEIPTTTFEFIPIYIYPVYVSAGQVLFLELSHDSDAFGEWNGNNTNPYSGGEAWSYSGTYESQPSDDMALITQINVNDTSRVHAITVFGETGQVRLGDIIFPRETGAFNQVLKMGYSNQLEWGNQSGGVFANSAGVVHNTGNHDIDDFVFGDHHLTSMFTNLMFFDKDLGAFRTGRTTNDYWQPANIGQFSFANGWNTQASGYCSQATGRLTQALGEYSTANGYQSVSTGDYAFSAGQTTIAGGENSMAFGLNTIASGMAASALGEGNIAGGDRSFATGNASSALGNMSFAAGLGCKATGAISTTLGQGTTAWGYASTVIGMYNNPVALFPQTQYAWDTPLFIIGNGENENFRSNAFMVRKNGRVGIGTDDPAVQVHVHANVSPTELKLESISHDATLSLQHGQHTWDYTLDHDLDNNLFWKYNNTTNMVLSHDGRMAIGSDEMATGYHLSVNGKIIAEEIRCQLKADWPDYVFAPDYPLMPLDQLEVSIKEKGHLPGIPPASAIDGHGFDVAAMQVNMMEKIEELTLYVLQLHQRIAELEKENALISQTMPHPESSKN